MVEELFRWQELDVKLSQSFSPATAISRGDLFHGRRAIVRRLIDTVNQAGQHAIIYGERGVGKTSLANVLSEFLRPFSSENIASARFNCSRETSYRDIWESLFRSTGLPTKEQYDTFTPGDVFDALRQDSDRKLILIVDEFDRLSDPDVDTMFADTIKTLSDFDLDTTLILVGVADDIDDLIPEHESIDRCLVQIHLSRMPLEELAAIVTAGISTVSMEISAEAVSKYATYLWDCPTVALGLASGKQYATYLWDCPTTYTRWASLQAGQQLTTRDWPLSLRMYVQLSKRWSKKASRAFSASSIWQRQARGARTFISRPYLPVRYRPRMISVASGRVMFVSPTPELWDGRCRYRRMPGTCTG